MMSMIFYMNIGVDVIEIIVYGVGVMKLLIYWWCVIIYFIVLILILLLQSG